MLNRSSIDLQFQLANSFKTIPVILSVEQRELVMQYQGINP